MKPDTPRAGPKARWDRRNREDTLAALRRDNDRGIVRPLGERAGA